MEKYTSVIIKIAAIFLFFAILFAGYRFDIAYQHHRYLRAREHGDILNHQINMLKQQIQNNTSLQAQLAQQKTSFAKAILIMPAAGQLNDYLNSIVHMGQADNLKFTSVNPQTSEAHDFYHAIPVQMTIVGTYQQFTQFLQAVMAANTISNWTNWAMVRQEPATTVVVNANDQDALTITATAVFYSYP
jgi:Tfp pilus assembly protein PilO